ncbi:MAG: GIY-YIG nuclease family protein [Bacteroidetes bacterium]|nr:GIY-YIG nuclease family protein [Bacteroidota bacterium]
MDQKSYCVYILKCADESYYTGVTSDLETRINQHQSGSFSGFTSKRRPVILIWSQEFQDINEAILAEKKLKGWSRSKKEALISGNWELVSTLAKKKF